MDFAQRLKQLRKQRKGLSQRKLGEEIGVSGGAIAMYESGKRIPDRSILVRIADFFGVTTDYLLGREEVPGGGKEDIDFEDVETLAAMRGLITEFEGYEDLPEEAKELLKDIVRDVFRRYSKKSKRGDDPTS